MNADTMGDNRITNTAQGAIAFGAAYDAAGRLSQAVYSNGAFTVSYVYDLTNGLLRQVSDNLTGVSITFTYDLDHNLAGIDHELLDLPGQNQQRAGPSPCRRRRSPPRAGR